MTEKDRKLLAKDIAEEMKNHTPSIVCPNGISPEVAQGIKDFVNMMNSSKKTAAKAFVTFVVLGTLSGLVYAFWAKVGEYINKLTGK